MCSIKNDEKVILEPTEKVACQGPRAVDFLSNIRVLNKVTPNQAKERLLVLTFWPRGINTNDFPFFGTERSNPSSVFTEKIAIDRLPDPLRQFIEF